MNIEELAFENRKTLANLNGIDLLDIIEFLQEDRNQWINQFTKTHNESVEIQKENQELKSQLAGTTHCFDEQEHRKLKKQLEEINNFIKKSGFVNIEQVTLNYCGLLTQEKEFIKYLEDEWARHEYISAHEVFDENKRLTEQKIRSNIFEILQKYKEIIQTKNNNSV